ncbi:MAG: S46 family peptidase [Rikenellaceae bacterium]|nr:S46 family peptidase [Rikenellaceae bacterium]
MKRTLLLVALIVATSLSAVADKGMWLPSLISSRIKDMKQKGFKLSAEDIYSINKASMKDAVVLFDGGCTGEIVTEQGLLLTNHHCGYDAIQALSTVEHDYLTNGFWAMSNAEELPCPGLKVHILVRMEEVTERIAAGESRDEIIAKAEAEGVGFKASVESMYYGNEAYLFIYREFSDVRLVGAPPTTIGKFGADNDNWIWPRHTGDFSIFRIYADKDNNPAAYSADNKPYTPARHFEISTKGVKEGDFTMIYGFPGNTQEYITSDAVRYVAETSDPLKIDLRTQRLDIIGAAQKQSSETRIKYAAKQANIANAWKKWQGEVKGINRLGTLSKKLDYEARFRKDNPDKAYLLDSLSEAYNRNYEGYFTYELYNETLRGIELQQVVYIGLNSTIDDEKKAAAMAQFYKDFDINVDRQLAVAMLTAYCDNALVISEELEALVAAHGGAAAYAEWLYDNTKLDSIEGATMEAILNDPITEFVFAIEPIREFASHYAYRNFSNIPDIERWYRPYVKALMEWDKERAFFPDANLTLRVAYGKVAGYDYADGEYHLPQTTLEGIIAKDNPEIYDYNVPQALRDAYAKKDYGRWGVNINGKYTVPVCFIATNHTTGGNSGSPVINGKGELIGINFDRTWLSTMSDIEFDETLCRNIICDIRYVLFVIDKVGGAGWLIDEMGIK